MRISGDIIQAGLSGWVITGDWQYSTEIPALNLEAGLIAQPGTFADIAMNLGALLGPQSLIAQALIDIPALTIGGWLLPAQPTQQQFVASPTMFPGKVLELLGLVQGNAVGNVNVQGTWVLIPDDVNQTPFAQAVKWLGTETITPIRASIGLTSATGQYGVTTGVGDYTLRD